MEYVKRGVGGTPKGKSKRGLLNFVWRTQATTPASQAPREGKQPGIGRLGARKARQGAPPRFIRAIAPLKEGYIGPRAVKGASHVFCPTLDSPTDVTKAAAGNGNSGTNPGSLDSD
jgi:hypothetical protein